MSKKINFPIDFVITWVDQNDVNWQNNYNKYVTKNTDVDKYIRYRDYGTLKYVFRSIEKYANWVNHVYLVTDNQIPSWLNKSYSKITVIDHTQIIPEKYLPTFNSNVIDFHLKNIQNLCEHFVYFNDDMFLNKSVKPEDFFDTSGEIKDNIGFNTLMPTSVFDYSLMNDFVILNSHFNKKVFQKKEWKKIFSLKNGYWSIISLLLLPFPRFSRLIDPHIPVSYRKSQIENVISENPEIKTFFSNRIRKETDYSLWIVRYFELLSGNFSLRKINFGKRYGLDQIDKVVDDISHSKHSLININDADIDQAKFEENIIRLQNCYSKKLAEKSKYEL